IADRDLVVVDELAIAAAARLHILMHDDALDHRPCQAGGLDLGLAPGDLVLRPGASVVEVMQRGHHAGRAGLAHMRKLNRIVGTDPAPGLFQAYFPVEERDARAAAAPSLRKMSRWVETRFSSAARWALLLAKPVSSKIAATVFPAGCAVCAIFASG